MKRWLLLISFLISSCTPSIGTEPSSYSDRSQNFTVDNSVDPITGEDTSIAYINELPSIADRTASVIWGCQDVILRVAVYPDEGLGISEAQVQYRFDDLEAITDKGWQVTDTAIFFPSIKGLDFTAFALGLQVERFAFRVTDGDNKPHTYLFDLSGLRSALEQLPCAKPLFK